MQHLSNLRQRPLSRNLLTRVLETPELPQQVQSLPPQQLGRLIDRVGLEDAGELVALATTEQLAGIFDDDLWRSEAAGKDERFDSERFLLWLEIMLEAGEKAVAERLAELPEDLVTLALHRHLLVISLDDLRAELEAGDDEAEAAEKAFESCLTEEIDEYQLIWKGGDGFDSVMAALLALDREHHAFSARLLERCAALSSEYISDNGGLYQVLSADEMLEQDLACEREGRRAERGYVAPSAAAAFLRLACGPAGSETPVTEHDPLTRAYFRELSRRPLTAPAERRDEVRDPRGLAALLQADGVSSERAASPARLGSSREREALLPRAMRELRERDPAAFAERSEELAYLSNVLVAASSPDRRLQPLEAVDHAASCVSLGLWLVCGARASSSEAVRVLQAHPCDGLFRVALAAASSRNEAPKSRKHDAALLARARALLERLKIG